MWLPVPPVVMMAVVVMMALVMPAVVVPTMPPVMVPAVPPVAVMPMMVMTMPVSPPSCFLRNSCRRVHHSLVRRYGSGLTDCRSRQKCEGKTHRGDCHRIFHV